MRWKSKATALIVGFVIGVAVVFIFKFGAGFFAHKEQNAPASSGLRCDEETTFNSLEEIIAALKSENVSVRREVRKKLFVRPILKTNYFDYERDINYPERAENISSQLVQLDGDEKHEVIIRFARLENPVAIVLKEDACGWRVIASFSAWLRFEEYPYRNWFELHETVDREASEILLRESTSDSTSYVRKARLLRLIDGEFKQIAEFEEENLQPFENYKGEDWSEVKLRRNSEVSFEKPGQIKIKTTEEQIKYEGTSSAQIFFSDTDGSWHTTRRHWHTRAFRRLKIIDERATTLIWENERLEFQIEEQR